MCDLLETPRAFPATHAANPPKTIPQSVQVPVGRLVVEWAAAWVAVRQPVGWVLVAIALVLDALVLVELGVEGDATGHLCDPLGHHHIASVGASEVAGGLRGMWPKHRRAPQKQNES